MSIEPNYFAVTINKHPSKQGKEKDIGFYSSKIIADYVVKLIPCAFSNDIECATVPRYAVLKRTNAGLRLEDTSNGQLTMIEETWNSTVAKKLLKFVPFVINRKEMENRITDIPKNVADQPKRISEDGYHAVVSAVPAEHFIRAY